MDNRRTDRKRALGVQRKLAMLAGVLLGLVPAIAGAAEYKWKGSANDVDNPGGGMWRVAANWMGGAPMSAATNELVFNVGTSTYVSENNNGGAFFQLNKLTLSPNDNMKTGTIEGAPIEFVKTGGTAPVISLNSTEIFPASFTLNPRQIKTNEFLTIDASLLGATRSLVIGGTNKGGLTGAGSIEQKNGRVVLSGNSQNTLRNSMADDMTYTVSHGHLTLDKTEGRTAVNGNLKIGGASVDTGYEATVLYNQNEQVADSATIKLQAVATAGFGATAHARLLLSGKTETVRGLSATTGPAIMPPRDFIELSLGAGQLTLKGDYAADTRHPVKATLSGTAQSKITKDGRRYTWVFEGNGDDFMGSVEVAAGTFEVAVGSMLGKNEAGKKCSGVTVKKRARVVGAANINCKVTEEMARGGPAPMGLTVELGGRLVPKSQSAMSPGEDPDEPPAPFDAPGILTALEAQLDPGSFLEIELGGTEAGYGPGNHSQLHVLDGEAIIGGSYLQLMLSSPPSLDAEYMILRNDAGSSIDGEFAGKPQDSYYTTYYGGNPFIFKINYFGGDGNDVVLTHVATPEPGSIVLLVLGSVMLRTRRRTPGVARSARHELGSGGQPTPTRVPLWLENRRDRAQVSPVH